MTSKKGRGVLKPIDEATTPSAVSSRPRRRAATKALDVIDNDLARRRELTDSQRAEEDEDSQDYGFSESLDDNEEPTSSEDIEDEDDDDDEEEEPPKRRRKAAPKREAEDDEEGSGE